MCALKRLHTSYISSQEINIIRAAETSLNKYRGADKSLARPGRKQARKHVRDARDFNNIETRDVIKFFFSSKAPKEIHAILTETLACFPPGRAKDLSATLTRLQFIYQSEDHNLEPTTYIPP